MGINWLDIVLIVVLIATVLSGVIKGFIRSLVGIAAAVGGLILASQYFKTFARVAQAVISSPLWANLIGFLSVFLVVLLLGWGLGFLLSKLMKGPLHFMDHVLGGFFGFVKGVLICGICVLALVVFPIDRDAVKKSRLAPSCIQVARAAILLIPAELKAKFKETYLAIKESAEDHGQKN
ncbi:MAG: CvpA family protein [Candidatus Aminicenantes bacterium]|nr:CvpA family protein [Candidatus Aminicenantes bacterium]